ncbi:hypothetical protein MT344_04090 [Clavibacter michiganensis subsp. phaseoli]|uniref:hypothetical protein n=1 Tax=Clavibacter phaseoli TaxID=1734031 RepID=UPI001FB45C4E|nr:hypothetical protein [Clavibacter phaseoli]MCJ1710363.1 hypothetical protein [Clavibacter phaseoli]
MNPHENGYRIDDGRQVNLGRPELIPFDDVRALYVELGEKVKDRQRTMRDLNAARDRLVRAPDVDARANAAAARSGEPLLNAAEEKAKAEIATLTTQYKALCALEPEMYGELKGLVTAHKEEWKVMALKDAEDARAAVISTHRVLVDNGAKYQQAAGTLRMLIEGEKLVYGASVGHVEVSVGASKVVEGYQRMGAHIENLERERLSSFTPAHDAGLDGQ